MTTLLSTTHRLGLERIGMMDGFDSLRRTTTVSGSGARTSSMPSMRNFVFALRLITRSSDHLTSADVIGLPLENRTFGRSVNVYVFPSGEAFQPVASCGFGVLRSSPSKVTSES